MILPTSEAVRLFIAGGRALAKMESNGIRVDESYLSTAVTNVEGCLKELTEKLISSEFYQAWKKHFKSQTKLGSRQQLAWLVYNHLGYKPTQFTETGQPSTEESAFETVNESFIDDYFRAQKYSKLLNTYLKNVQREITGGFLHPFFHIHTTSTGRGSSADPNFQNLPIRDEEIGKILRSCFVPRKGRRLVEIDFGAMEFIIAANFWKDPGMLAYASDPNKDIHRDYAALCYTCTPAQVSKMMRTIAKNQFVFPVLYGSYYISCARGLWESIDKFSLKLVDGTLLNDHLTKSGIGSLGYCDPRHRPRPGTFEHLIKSTEDNFFNTFSTFAGRKEEWLHQYYKHGGFRSPTGFACNGEYSANFLMNAPVQGSAFHCLLQALVWLMEWLESKSTMAVAQIHDCILLDAVISEIQDVLNMAEYCMTTRLQEEWDWIVAPLKIEVDVTPVDGTWAEKAPWIKRNGKWGPK